jgi:thiol-disulfide isomerase/thioredoxin
MVVIPDKEKIMSIRTRPHTSLVTFILTGLLVLSACSTAIPLAKSIPVAATVTPIVPTATTLPDWFNYKMTDVRTGQTFSMDDFAGKVVLLETMAQWCINCVQQQNEVKKLEGLTDNSKDLVLVSLDTDLHEDAASLKKYADTYGFDWYFAISPLDVDRALSNLYDSEYMNPPLAPMLFIDRQGAVYSLPFGPMKGAVPLQRTLAPYLTP